VVRTLNSAPLALAALLGLTGAAWAQTPPEGWGRDLSATETHETLEYVVRAPSTAPAALGGVGGAVAAAKGTRWHEDLLVLRSGPSADAHLVYAFVEPEGDGPRLRRVVFELWADTIVGFVGISEGAQPGVTPRALYAEGSVRLVIEAPEGEAVLECEKVYLDLAAEQAFLFEAEARGQSPRAPGVLAGASPVLRARWVRVHGPHLVVGEEASATACDHGVPHFALNARRVTLSRPVGQEQPPRLLAGFLTGAQRTGSDAIQRESARPRDVHLRDVTLSVLGHELPFLPFVRWNTSWPLPTLRAGHSSRFGNFGSAGLKLELATVDLGPAGSLELDGQARGDYFERRGSGVEGGLGWRRDTASSSSEGFFRGHYQRDRGDLDRVGTPITTDDRYWMRGLARERLPGGVQLDAEFSMLSDRGFLLEYHRDVAKSEKEQETYLNGRWSYDDFAAQLLARWRINDFQTQVERLPEARLDWIRTPLWTHDWLGGFYLDVSGRGGQLRLRPDDDLTLTDTGRVERIDGRVALDYAVSLGPLELRGFAAGRETAWSERVGADESIERFLAESGWKASTTFWADYATSWSTLRHELVPEVGMFHRYRVTRDPAELILFDPDVEALLPTDYLFLRLRTRLLADALGVRRKLLDVAVESRYFLRDRGADVGRRWGSVFYDLRLELVSWFSARARAEQDVNGGGLISLDVSGTVRPCDWAEATAAYRERPGVSRALSWGVRVRLTPAWQVAFEQQYDFLSDEFLYHRGRLIRSFHRFAVELSAKHDPQQDDTSVSVGISLAPLFSARQDPFQRDPTRDLYD
jgi:hypothetical protein